ncbi:MAG: hypothetical protein KGK00_06085, partial [Paracoccaceae bacterium]|nr:hypothetical protein [Paracoccaceae bacterium]
LCAPALAAAPEVGPVTGLPIPRFVSLKGNKGNARRGPSLTQRIDWVFTRAGMPLKVTGEYDHWRRVEDKDGLGGWLHYTLIAGARTVVILSPMAKLHALPEEGAPVTAEAQQNAIAHLFAAKPNWCRIGAQGDSGWIARKDIWGVLPNEVFG